MNTKSLGRKLPISPAILFLIFFAIGSAACEADPSDRAVNAGSESNVAAPASLPGSASEAKMKVPASIDSEHRELHEQLEITLRSGGKTGEAAAKVEQVLSKHFENEEKYALPQLGLLPALATGNVSPDMRPAIALSDKLKAEMPQMLSEHKELGVALDGLIAAARSENKPQAAEFAQHLKAQAQHEEEILYPAAILVGEYLKLKLDTPAT